MLSDHGRSQLMRTDRIGALTRRQFVGTCAVGGLAALLGRDARGAQDRPSLAGEVGLTTGSFMRHLSVHEQPGKLRLLDVPRIMRDELDMRVLDLMTATLASFEPAYVDELRETAERHGCVITNLKMNQKGLEMASPDADLRRASLHEYRRTIDVAAQLGCRWVRPLPGAKEPDRRRLIEAYRELIDYAAPKGISLLVENFGWIQDRPEVIPSIIEDVGEGFAASVDTGNWTAAAREAGLHAAFPLAVTCDFKARQLGENGEHPQYDLKRCFEIGWTAGYRGPWCLEHFDESLPRLLENMRTLRASLKQWIGDAPQSHAAILLRGLKALDLPDCHWAFES